MIANKGKKTALKKGGTILYPTDTIWGIGCDATNLESVNKIYKIKKRKKSKMLISLVANEKQLRQLIGRNKFYLNKYKKV